MQLKYTEKQIKKILILQQDQSDCGVACLLSLIKLNEGDNSLEKLREMSGTTIQGTTLLGLYQAANQLGFKAQGCESDIQGLINHLSPVILHLTIDKQLQHYVIFFGVSESKFIIGDPAKGICYYTEEELNKLWISKTCLILEPSKNFVKEAQSNEAKKIWFFNLLRKDYQLLIFSTVLGLITAILGLVMAVFSQKIIDDILPSKEYTKLITGISLVTFLLLVKTGFSMIRSYFLLKQSKDFNNRITANFYGSLLKLPKPFFDTRKIGELVSRLNDTQRVQEVIQHVANNFVVNILISIVSLVFLFYYSWQVGLIAIISLPVYFLLIYGFNNKIITSQKEVMQARAHSQSNYIATMNGIAAIKNNNKQSLFQKLNKKIYGDYQNRVFDLGKIHIRLSLFSGIFSVLFLMAILTYTCMSVYYDNLEIGQLIAILGVAGSLLPAVANIALIAIPINEANIAFNRMYEFASIEKEKGGTNHISSFESLCIKNLKFRFAGRSPLLKDVSLHVSKGECIAITGESGSGKSTLGQIIQRFYIPEQGDVIVNGKYSLDQISLSSWRNHIGVIEQEVKVFNGTVLDNIVLTGDYIPENIIDFCKSLGLHEYISKFPLGYATILGEEGINLSGGQKQIITLARALYKKPQLLILDEYTSAMDRKTEQFSLQLLQKIKKQVGIVFISHRLHSLPKIADRIYVIEKGETKISGTHQELLETANFYSDFWNELNYQTYNSSKEETNSYNSPSIVWEI